MLDARDGTVSLSRSASASLHAPFGAQSAVRAELCTTILLGESVPQFGAVETAHPRWEEVLRRVEWGIPIQVDDRRIRAFDRTRQQSVRDGFSCWC